MPGMSKHRETESLSMLYAGCAKGKNRDILLLGYEEKNAEMLFREHTQGWIAITQPTHAWLSGQLARAWGNECFGEVAPWEEVCLGASAHTQPADGAPLQLS
jgi:hypothetical protein